MRACIYGNRNADRSMNVCEDEWIVAYALLKRRPTRAGKIKGDRRADPRLGLNVGNSRVVPRAMPRQNTGPRQITEVKRRWATQREPALQRGTALDESSRIVVLIYLFDFIQNQVGPVRPLPYPLVEKSQTPYDNSNKSPLSEITNHKQM